MFQCCFNSKFILKHGLVLHLIFHDFAVGIDGKTIHKFDEARYFKLWYVSLAKVSYLVGTQRLICVWNNPYTYFFANSCVRHLIHILEYLKLLFWIIVTILITPNASTALIFGWVRRKPSISAGYMLAPPRIIMSFPRLLKYK